MELRKYGIPVLQLSEPMREPKSRKSNKSPGYAEIGCIQFIPRGIRCLKQKALYIRIRNYSHCFRQILSREALLSLSRMPVRSCLHEVWQKSFSEINPH